MEPDVMEQLCDAIRTGDPWHADGVKVHAALLRDALRSVSDPAPDGLTIVGAEIVGEVDLGRLEIGFPLVFEGVTFRRRVNLAGLKARDIWFAGGVVNVEQAPGSALDAHGLECSSLALGSLTVHLDPHGPVGAAINLWGAHVAGDLHLEGVDVEVHGTADRVWSLWLREAQVDGDVGITVCRLPGTVELDGSTVARRLYLDGTRTQPALTTDRLSLDRASIGVLQPNLMDLGDGVLSMAGTRIDTLQVWDPARRPSGSDFAGTWPRVESTSLEVGRVDVPESEVDDLVEWLAPRRRPQGTFHRQPALSLAKVLAADGLQGAATRARVRAEDHFRAQRIDRWSSQVPGWTPVGRVLKHAWRHATRITAGHGHATSRAVLGIVVCMLGVYVATLVGRAQDDFEYIGAAGTQPELFPGIFTIDTVLSPMELGQTDSWIATSFALTLVVAIFKGGALFFAAMAVGSLSGLFQRD